MMKTTLSKLCHIHIFHYLHENCPSEYLSSQIEIEYTFVKTELHTFILQIGLYVINFDALVN